MPCSINYGTRTDSERRTNMQYGGGRKSRSTLGCNLKSHETTEPDLFALWLDYACNESCLCSFKCPAYLTRILMRGPCRPVVT